jgi:ABC-type glycerol-3-phosphate transport system permease component
MTASRRAVWLSRAILIAVSVLILMPLVYLVGVSFKAPQLIFANPILPFTIPPSLENYQAVLRQMDIPRYLLNSIAFAGSVTLGQLALAIPAAFSFAYFKFRFKNFFLGMIIISLMVPFVVTYIPNYLLLAQWRLINTLPGLILPMLGISLGFGIFLLRQHFMSFPREVMEAAMIDGANSWDILWRVLMPANLSPVLAVGIYVLINTWNQFIWPLLVGGGNPRSYTLTVAVQIFYTSPEGGDYWGAIMAASVLTSLPTAIIFILMRRRVLTTFVDGAIKG